MPLSGITTHENQVEQTVLPAVCGFSARNPRTAADLPEDGRSALQGSIFIGATHEVRNHCCSRRKET
jgi:hypothetical protein